MAEAVGLQARAPETVPVEAPRRHRRMPAPLAALLAVTLIVGVTWALLTPPWQVPDENAHFAYVQSLVDGPGLPGKAGRPTFSSEQANASVAANSDQTADSLVTKPEWNARQAESFGAADRTLPAKDRGDGGGPNPAGSNPPLAYLAYAVPYLAAKGASIFSRLAAMRVFSVLWLLATVAATWALAGEAFGRRRDLQLTAAALPALAPMVTFVSASVQPDAALIATWTAALWLGARLLRRGLTAGRAAAFLGMVGLACVVKATSYALLPGALLAVVLAVLRARPLPAARAGRALVPAAAALAIPLGGWIVLARVLARPASQQLTAAASAQGFDPRELVSYVWQFYLPRLPFMSDMGSSLPVYQVFIKGAWGRFGWLETVFPGPVYWLLGVVTLLVAVLAAVRLWRARRRLDRGLLAFFALVALTLLAGLHWQEYHNLSLGLGRLMQGRYILPLVGLAGLATAAAVDGLPRRLRHAGPALVLAGLFALQLFSLGLMVERFYA